MARQTEENDMKFGSLLISCGLAASLFLVGMLYAQGQAPTISTTAVSEGSSLDVLLEDLKQRREARTVTVEQPVTARDPKVTRLQNELIDLRVERDRLEMHVMQLEARLQRVTVVGTSSRCRNEDCVPIQKFEDERIRLQSTHAVSLYIYGKELYELTTDVEIRKKATKMMTIAINDLELLGFDTTDLVTGDIYDLLSQKGDGTDQARRR